MSNRQEKLETDRKRLLEILQTQARGKENAIPRRRLSEATKLEDRYMRDCILDLRRAGHPVGIGNVTGAKDSGGYYYAVTMPEVKEVVEEFRSLAREHSITSNLLARNYPEIAELQLVLVDRAGQTKLGV